jgi:hypothetical protein
LLIDTGMSEASAEWATRNSANQAARQELATCAKVKSEMTDIVPVREEKGRGVAWGEGGPPVAFENP